jgi:hypothetical protein
MRKKRQLSVEELDYQYSKIVQKIDSRGDFEKVQSKDALIYCILLIDSEVRNGGLSQFLHNYSGEYAIDVVNGLRKIGWTAFANEFSSLLVELFGSEYPADTEKRRKIMNGFTSNMEKSIEELSQRYFEYEPTAPECLAKFLSSETDSSL